MHTCTSISGLCWDLTCCCKNYGRLKKKPERKDVCRWRCKSNRPVTAGLEGGYLTSVVTGGLVENLSDACVFDQAANATYVIMLIVIQRSAAPWRPTVAADLFNQFNLNLIWKKRGGFRDFFLKKKHSWLVVWMGIFQRGLNVPGGGRDDLQASDKQRRQVLFISNTQ